MSVREPDSLARLKALLLEEGGLMASLVDGSSLDGSTVDDSSVDDSSVDSSTVDSSPLDGSSVDGASIGGSSVDGSTVGIPAGPAQLAARGPRAQGHDADYELLVETIYEGYLLHYHAPRVVHPPEDDLGLLAGDRLYALGLAHLVKLGDVEAVAELADVITLGALAQGSGNPELAEAVWMAGARAVGWGANPHYEHAKALARAGSPDALEAMSDCATIEA